jgi:hypothetical protein
MVGFSARAEPAVTIAAQMMPPQIPIDRICKSPGNPVIPTDSIACCLIAAKNHVLEAPAISAAPADQCIAISARSLFHPGVVRPGVVRPDHPRRPVQKHHKGHIIRPAAPDFFPALRSRSN